MKKTITKENFIKIFSNPIYRKKLDKIILNFFGLENTIVEEEKNNIENDILLEFILLINTEYTLKIIVKDTKKLFKTSKKFYINLSYREVEKHHELLMPGYWEIYCRYAYENQKETPKLLLIAALFYCTTTKEAEKILIKLKMFSNMEIKDILRIVEEENKDK